MKRNALFVGVNNYSDRDIHPLRFAVEDATDLAGFFKHCAKFNRAEVLTDPRNCDAVLERVHDMLSGLGPGDEFLFFFAGHGVTTHDGHRLVCSSDRLSAVKHAWAGLPLERLKLETAGSFNRLFLLDACRSDVLATNRGASCAMETGTRDLIMAGASSADEKDGVLTILCSCDDNECAGESAVLRHGLFSKAMLEMLDEEHRDGRIVLLDDDFVYRRLPERMRLLAQESDMDFSQKPQKRGPAILLLDGIASASAVPPVSQLSFPSAAYVVCPLCGKHNDVKDTFRCPACGKDHLCLSHQSKEYYCCPSCAGKTSTTGVSELKKADGFYDDGQFQLAAAIYEKFASVGNAQAQYQIGRMYCQGKGVPQDSGVAVKWFRRAAEQGHVKGQCQLALLHTLGRGVPRDLGEVAKWYRRAAEQGDASAQTMLGSMLENGHGVAQNYAEAVEWYRRAVDHGYAEAQYRLGNAYKDGHGVSQDYVAAVMLYRKAAEQGISSAQYALGRMYEKGLGVSQNCNEAVKWYRCVAEQRFAMLRGEAEKALKRLGANQGNGDARARLPELENQGAGDGGEPDGLDDEKRTVERNKADSNKRMTIPLRRPQLRVNLVEGGVSGGDRVGRYCGPMENGKPHGTGRFFSSSGYVYTGVFFNGVRSGKGKIEYKDGATYEGGFYEGEWSGEGTYTWPNGTQHIGQFRNGKFHGPGRQINPDGTSFTGNWEYGKLTAYT